MKKIVSIVVLTLAVIGCNNTKVGEDETPVDNFDRSIILETWADQIIIPVFTDLEAQLTDLVDAKDAFVSTPSQMNLDALRTAWINAYKVWQYAEMFNIGKAEELNYGFHMNIFPTSVEDIEANIASGSYDLSHVNNNDAIGFPALDYLLYGLGEDDASLLEFYTTNANATGYLAYVSDVVDQMKSLTETVLNDWVSSYRDEFINSTDNTSTSSTNKLVNDYIFYFEKGLRANKIGIPAGIFSVDPLANKVEAYYQGQLSKTLALEALKASQDFFNGKAYKSSVLGSSLDDYLDYLNTLKGGEDIAQMINDQFDSARARIQELDDSFTTQISTDNTKMTIAFDELQKAVIYLKVDMIQAMNISVDYVDADGD